VNKEIISKNNTHKLKIIFDVAHNLQKMKAFTDALNRLFPKNKFNYIIGFSNDKDIKNMIKLIIPSAKNIYITTFNHPIKKSQDPYEIYNFIKQNDFNNVKIANSVDEAFGQAKSNIFSNDEIIIITGSCYIVGEAHRLIL